MKFEIIPTKDILYDKCENMEQLYDNYYYQLFVEYKELKKQNEFLMKRDNKCQVLEQRIDKAINFLKRWGEEPDADMYLQMKEYKEFNELLDILKEVK